MEGRDIRKSVRELNHRCLHDPATPSELVQDCGVGRGKWSIVEAQVLEIGSVVLEQHIKKKSLCVPGICFFKVYFDCLHLCACKCVFVQNVDGRLQWLWRLEEGVRWSYSTWQGCWELSSLKEPSEGTQMPWDTKPLTGSYTWTKLLFSLSFWDNFLHSQHLRATMTQRQKLPLTRQLLSSSILRQ